MAQLKPPPNLSLEGNLAENWRTWLQRYELFAVASGVAEKSEGVQCATFLHVAGEEAIKVSNTFVFADAERNKIAALTQKFREYCEPRKNMPYIRHMFFTRAQGPSETIDAYVTDLKYKAKDCEFGNLCNSLIRDRIVCGIRDDQVRARLLREADLTMEKALDVCRASEITFTQMKALHDEVEVHKVSTARAYKKGARSTKESSMNSEKKVDCDRCGYKHEQRKCPAYGQTCRKCDKINHFAKMCRVNSQPKNKKMHVVEQQDGDDDSDAEEMFIGTIEMRSIDAIENTKCDQDRWSEELLISKKRVKFRIDTGADCNVMSAKTFHSLNITGKLHASGCKLVAYSGHKMEPLGKTSVTCLYKGQKHKIDFEIIEKDAPAILGRETSTTLKMVKRMYNMEKENKMQKDYEHLFSGLGCLPGEHSIKIDPEIRPVIHAPRKIPVALRDRVIEQLHKMEQSDVITRQSEPTQWVNSMVTVVTPKKIRICMDPKDLNTAIRREHYPLLTVEEVVSRMPNAKYFSVLDANQGFYQIKLDEESSKLCTFNTPIGRYRFKRLPFGISSASEVFQRAVAQMIEGLDGVVNIIDDLLVWGDTLEQHDRRLMRLLQRADENGLRFNKSKCKFRMTEVKYIGHTLSADGLKPDDEKIRAIVQIPPPADKQALLRFMGMIQYLAKFIPNLSDVSAPLRQLLQGETEWHWEEPQQQSFEKLKQLITVAPTLKYYDVNKAVTLSVDASSEGIGAVLLQDERPVAYGSRALTECQRRYAQIEKELLAIVYGCEKFHQYVYGREVQVESDHKPLESIFKKPLHQAPMRLQRMLLRLQKYNIAVTYKPGKELHIADALSRAYLREQREDLLEEELQVNWITPQLPISEEKLEMFRNATAQDPVLQELKNMTMRGWPRDRSAVSESIQPFWTFREEISFASGLLFKSEKLIVPQQLRSQMLDKIHESHLGMVKCKERARDVLYWPGMSAQIEKVVAQCAVCNEHRNCNQKEPLISHPLPNRPWEKVGSDMFHSDGSEYLLCVDYFSKYPEIMRLTDTTSKGVITAMKSIYARHGIPDILVSDNAPQYASAEFKSFAESWEFSHVTSSPHYAQSNGQAEKAVQTVKRLLKKSGDPYIALLEYRNTPLEGVGLSPAQMLMGRRLKTKLPASTSLLTPEGALRVHNKLKEKQAKQKSYYDRHATHLPELHAGENVRMQSGSTWKPAVVLREHEQHRSYVVRTPEGRMFRRNRRHLRETAEREFPSAAAERDVDVDMNCDNERFTDQDNSRAQTSAHAPLSHSNTTDSRKQPYYTRSGRLVKTPPRFRE